MRATVRGIGFDRFTPSPSKRLPPALRECRRDSENR
jgi:hypothetical protein